MDPTTLADRVRALPPPLDDRFGRRLGGVRRTRGARRDRALRAIARDLDRVEHEIDARRRARPDRIAYPEDLPIVARREELLAAIRDHQVVIVAGETGSGKSTQLPKLCLELGRGVAGRIGHTQPRRIAARTIAARVAEELGTEIGQAVGYEVRFDRRASDATSIKVMTEGILLNEIHHDRRLEAYDTLILDEAHERSLDMDFLLGYLRGVLKRRPDLSLIVTSATIDTARFSAFFDDAPVVEVSGRTYPVEVRYRPLDDGDGRTRDQVQGICDAVLELSREGPGDILVFVSGEAEIRDAVAGLEELALPHTEILPLFGRLSLADQQRVFRTHTGRRVVVSTNIAETSLTVPGVRYVVDTGTARIARYSRRTKVQRLPIEPISRASADQRAGRCGRVGPGICIRLYSQEDYESRPEFTEPEIQRTNLASVILRMATLELGDVEAFPFIDPPDPRQVRAGRILLEELGALRDGAVTSIGRAMARFPIDPRLSRMVLSGAEADVLADVLVIVAGLAIQDPRERPLDRRDEADRLHRRFAHGSSDLLSWLFLWRYVHEERAARTSGGFRRMCRDEFLNYRRLREWQDVHRQLTELARELGHRPQRRPGTPDEIHRALLPGLLSHVGRRDPDGPGYRGARDIRFWLSPGSVAFKRRPQWVMAAELVETSRLWARTVAPIEPEWVEDAGKHLVRRSWSDPWWDPGRGEAVARETVTLFGLPLVTDRVVGYAKVDPVVARELFIRHALVGEEWDREHDFQLRNRALIDDVLDQETRERRGDLLADEAIVGFFDARVPEEVVSASTFDRWWKDARRRNPHLLDLRIDDVIADATAPPDVEAYPATWTVGGLRLPLEYRFSPGEPDDGVTVVVELGQLPRIDPAWFTWHVPGYREEVVEALVRRLPKRFRRELAPIGTTIAELVRTLDPADGPLPDVLRRALSARVGEPVPSDALDLAALSPHLRMHVRVVGPDGETVAEGDDIAAIRRRLADAARATLAQASHPLERNDLLGFPEGGLPTEVVLDDGTVAYPALVDDGTSVAVRLFPTEDERTLEHWRGVRRVFALDATAAREAVTRAITEDGRRVVRAGPHGSLDVFVDDVVLGAIDLLMREAGGAPLAEADFRRIERYVRTNLPDAAIEVATGALQVVDAAISLREDLDRLRGVPEETAEDVRAQVGRLVYPGFVAEIGPERLEDVARYVEAMRYRVTKAVERPDRDLERLARVRSLEAEHRRLLDRDGPTADLVEIDWMIQELRVLLFAEPIGVRGKVSEARVRRALAAAAA